MGGWVDGWNGWLMAHGSHMAVVAVTIVCPSSCARARACACVCARQLFPSPVLCLFLFSSVDIYQAQLTYLSLSLSAAYQFVTSVPRVIVIT